MKILSRGSIPFALNSIGLVGIGAEIGVGMGDYSFTILELWQGKKLYSIDPWTYQNDVVLDASNVSQREHNESYDICRSLLAPYKHRSEIIREFSVRAAERFADNSLDFVYIDARHDYRSVSADLNAWYRKVKIGGLFAGHDYKNSFVRCNLVEVKRAVDNWAITNQIGNVYSTTLDNLPSWYVIKKETV